MGPIVHGEYAQRFLGVRDAFAANFETGREVGASFAATVGGEFVVDIWAGHADQEGSRPWERDTITCIRSITKSMAALCAHILVDRGRLDFDTPVAEYWPEFGQAGKSAITPRHILSHSAGIAVIEEPLPANAVFDWERMIAAIEKQRPLWEPGTQHGYHGTLFGFLVGELVRRISGKTVGTFFRDEVAGPLDADVHIGLPKDQHARAVEMFSPSGPIPEESGEPASELEALLRSLRENPALWEAGRDWLANRGDSKCQRLWQRTLRCPGDVGPRVQQRGRRASSTGPGRRGQRVSRRSPRQGSCFRGRSDPVGAWLPGSRRTHSFHTKPANHRSWRHRRLWLRRRPGCPS